MNNVKRVTLYRLFGAVCAVNLAACLSTGAAHAQDFLAEDGQAPCALELSINSVADWSGPYGRGYEIFSPIDAYEPVIVEVRHTGAACDYYIVASPAAGGDGKSLANGSSELRFDLLTDTNGNSVISGDYYGGQISRLEGRFGAGPNTAYTTLLLYVPPGQMVRSGQYSGQLSLRLFKDTDTTPDLVSEQILPIAVSAPAAMRIHSPDFGEGQRSTNLDLGELTEGARQNVSFSVASNADLAVTLSSENAGILKHQAGGPGIPYFVNVAGQRADISSLSASRTLISARSAGQENDVPIDIIVPAQQHAVAGNYDDILTVTFTVQ